MCLVGEQWFGVGLPGTAAQTKEICICTTIGAVWCAGLASNGLNANLPVFGSLGKDNTM